MTLRAAALLVLGSALAAAQGTAPKGPRPARPTATKPAAPTPIDRWLRGMTLRERIAQLIVIRTHGHVGNPRAREWRDITRWVRQSRVGGVIVVNRVRRGSVIKAEPYETLQFLNRLQRMARVPLLVGGDFERSVSMRYDGPIAYPHAMAYGAAGRPEWTAELGAITVREARALGYQWIFAPDADVNSNPDNPIIGIRAFGVDPSTVSRHVTAFVQGAHAAKPRSLVTVKHFPGHGDTAVDTHVGMPEIDAARERLNATELPPFAAAITAGVDSVMTAHIALPRIAPSGVPATIASEVITGILRKDLGFQGIVTTDAMDMAALAAKYGSGEASVRALEAGVDVLLMPRDPDEAIAAVLKAIAAKRLTPARITASVRKVLAAKVRVGLDRAKLTDPDKVADVLEDEASAEHAQRVADGAVAVLGGARTLLPAPRGEGLCVLALAERRGNGQGVVLGEQIRARAPKARFLLLDPQLPEETLADLPENCETTIAAVFLGFGGTGKPNVVYEPLLERITRAPVRTILAALGNPFLTRAYPGAWLHLTTYSTVPASEIALAKALFGEIPASGQAFLEVKSTR